MNASDLRGVIVFQLFTPGINLCLSIWSYESALNTDETLFLYQTSQNAFAGLQTG